jgi:hypothetical protein
MKLLRSLMPAVILLACAAYTFAQQQPLPACALKNAPEFNGFQLGMTLAEVKSKLADTSMFDSKISSTNKIGTLAVRISGAELKDEYAEGIDDVNLVFVDSKLAVIKATYFSGAGNWLGAKDFFKQLSEKLGLPKMTASNSPGGRSEKYKVECTGFIVTLVYSFGVSPNVTITDALAQKLAEERWEQNPEGGTKRVTLTPGTKMPSPAPPGPR